VRSHQDKIIIHWLPGTLDPDWSLVVTFSSEIFCIMTSKLYNIAAGHCSDKLFFWLVYFLLRVKIN